MADIKIRVEGRKATNLTPEVKLVTWNEGYEIEFEFDESWSASNFKTALFIVCIRKRTLFTHIRKNYQKRL